MQFPLSATIFFKFPRVSTRGNLKKDFRCTRGYKTSHLPIYKGFKNLKTSFLIKLHKNLKNIWNDCDLVLIFAPRQGTKVL